ncbi:MAG: ATP-binding protein [Acidobacteriota bacterium]
MSSPKGSAKAVHLPQYHEIFERSGDIILALDSEHCIVFASPQWVRTTGFSTEETEGHSILRWLPEDEHDPWHALVTEVQGSDQACPLALTLEAKDQQAVEVEGWAMVEKGPSRRLALQLVLHDVTERHRLERQRQAHLERIEAQNLELARRIREAEQSNRLKSELMATVSHELRTPVNAICGFTDLLNDPATGELSEMQRSYLEFVRQGAHHLRDLIGDVLDLARLETGSLPLDLQSIELAPLLAEVASMTALLAKERRIHLELEAEAGLEIHADPVRLRQVLLNLVCNAVRYSPLDGKVEVTGERHGDRCLVTVTDAGPGLVPSLHEKVFEEFRQPGSGPRDPAGGTGLGLAIVRRLVEAQGGKVWVESEGRGDGCRFGFYLPTEAPKWSSGALRQAALVAASATKILIAGGPAAERRQRIAELRREGYAAIEVPALEDFPEMIRNLRPAAWVLDLDGIPDPWPAIAEISPRDDGGTLAIVMASTQSKSRAFLHGVDHYLIKPVTLGAISDCLRAHFPELGRGAKTVIVVMKPGEARDEVAEALVEAGLRPISARDGRRALRLIQELHPFAAIVSMDLPDSDGSQTLIRLRSDPVTAMMPLIALDDRTSGEGGPRRDRRATRWIDPTTSHWKEALIAALSSAPGGDS